MKKSANQKFKTFVKFRWLEKENQDFWKDIHRPQELKNLYGYGT